MTAGHQVVQRTPNPTLYLDFDGVLHPGHAQLQERFCRQAHLVAAIEGAEIDIVISSNWRLNYTVDRLKSMLHPTIGQRVVGITGDTLAGPHSRWREIERHAMLNRIRHLRALDASTQLFPPECGALIECVGSRGLGPAQAQMLRLWLEEIRVVS